MSRFRFSRHAVLSLAAVLALALGAASQITAAAPSPTPAANMAAMTSHTSKFAGAKVNGGTVSATTSGGRIALTYSDDFKIPDTPAPHWQVVDSKGNTYLLQRLKIKDDKVNKTITVPAYVQDVAKVQIWCAYAEVLLGEAAFDKPVK